jgi:hypothetical protein
MPVIRTPLFCNTNRSTHISWQGSLNGKMHSAAMTTATKDTTSAVNGKKTLQRDTQVGTGLINY